MNGRDGEGQIAANEPESSTPDSSGQPSGILLQASWDGPLPPPEILQHYDTIVPGAANRILEMAENWQRHQEQYEKTEQEQEGYALATTRKVVMGNSKRSYLGVICAFVIAITGLVGGIILSATGSWTSGLTISLSSLAILTGVFVYGTAARKAERRRSSASRIEE